MKANIVAPGGIPNRTSQIVTSIVPASGWLSVNQAGSKFYLVVATAELAIKPNNGSENKYVQGTGIACEELNYFANLQIRNPNPFPVIFQLFVGFGDYIDNRLIVYDPTVIQAPYSTSGIPNVANEILIPDLSGQAILGVNGEQYLALNRIAVYVSNVDNGDAYDIFNTDQDKTLLTVQPLTNVVYPANGAMSMKIPSGNINATVSEIYNVLRAL